MITVITVCYNAVKDIECTIKSVLKQNTDDIEYIIKDGSSDDGTLEIINEYKNVLESKLKHFILLSSKDSGIYNAMNIASEFATGERIIFLNAGDCFYSEDVLKKIITKNFQKDIVYGDVAHRKGNLIKAVKANQPISTIEERMFFSHQSAFIKTEIMKMYKYDEKYKICADYDFFLRCYKDGKSFQYVEFPVATYLIGGLSHIRPFDLMGEAYSIQYELGFLEYKTFKNQRKKNYINRRIHELFPKSLYMALRGVKEKIAHKDWIRIQNSD